MTGSTESSTTSPTPTSDSPSVDTATLPGADPNAPPAVLHDVLEQELRHLHFHRHPNRPIEDVRGNLVGLSLSGGGIRSATTGLGVLQAMSAMGVLPMVDYLCTVSGGGYIGSCLSSLLSLNERYVPTTPESTVVNPPGADKPRDPNARYTFASTDRPAFSVNEDRFPFRVDRGTVHGRLAIALVAHLRTHGNFLIARRGFIGRDTMRAIGNVLTGIVYNVLGFALTIASAAALWLAASAWLVPKLPRISFGSSGETTISDRYDDIWRHAVTHQSHIFRHLGVVFGIGFACSLVAYLIAIAVRDRPNAHDRAPKLGESQEEAFDIRMLWRYFFMLLGVTIAATYFTSQIWDPLRGDIALANLLLPLATLLGARVASFICGAVLLQLEERLWTRRLRSLWGGYQAITIYGIWITFAFSLFAPAAYALHDITAHVGVGGIISLIVARLFTSQTGRIKIGKIKLPVGVQHLLLALAVSGIVILGALGFATIFVEIPPQIDMLPVDTFLCIGLACLAVVALFGIVVDHNKLSLHYFYRDRLVETYLCSELSDNQRRMWRYRDAMEMPLSVLHGTPASDSVATWRNPAPYHLISAAINLAASRDLTRKDRKSGYWLFSRWYCGSVHTGFRPTAQYRGGSIKLGRAVAISGAAASPGAGFHTFFAQAFATVLFNVRLGYWVENPAHGSSLKGPNAQRFRTFWPWQLYKEVTMQTHEHGKLVNLSDGGHTGDNTGLYPLIQRRCKVIIVVDAEQDPSLTFGSFTEALRHVYVDLGVNVDIDLSMIRPDPVTGMSRSHCTVGRIRYPDRPYQDSYLVYMKNSLTGDEPAPVFNYKATSPDFPHEPTADQFFDDAQFESYRALGVHLAEHTFASWVGTPAFTDACRVHVGQG